jgi:hypothetical protein
VNSKLNVPKIVVKMEFVPMVNVIALQVGKVMIVLQMFNVQEDVVKKESV